MSELPKGVKTKLPTLDVVGFEYDHQMQFQDAPTREDVMRQVEAIQAEGKEADANGYFIVVRRRPGGWWANIFWKAAT
jgi:hypothetical protein